MKKQKYREKSKRVIFCGKPVEELDKEDLLCLIGSVVNMFDTYRNNINTDPNIEIKPIEKTKPENILQSLKNNSVEVHSDITRFIDSFVEENYDDYADSGDEQNWGRRFKENLSGKVTFSFDMVNDYTSLSKQEEYHEISFSLGPQNTKGFIDDSHFPTEYLEPLFQDFTSLGLMIDFNAAENYHIIYLNKKYNIEPLELWEVVRNRFLRSGFIEMED